MARPGRGRLARIRRALPLLVVAWERWQALPPKQRERYLKQARSYAEQARKAIEKRRPRR